MTKFTALPLNQCHDRSQLGPAGFEVVMRRQIRHLAQVRQPQANTKLRVRLVDSYGFN